MQFKGSCNVILYWYELRSLVWVLMCPMYWTQRRPARLTQ